VPITTTGGDLLVFFSAAAETNIPGSQTFFHLRVDGIDQKGSTITHPAGGAGGTNRAETTAIVAKLTGLAAGAHTVDVQWANDGSGATQTIDTTTGNEHGTLLVEEVSV
jgi:hypothetical protein